MSDQVLAACRGLSERLAIGDRGAVEQVVRRLEPHLVNYVYRLTGDADCAEALWLSAAVAVVGEIAAGSSRTPFDVVRALLLDSWDTSSALEGPLGSLAWEAREAVVLRLYHKLDAAEITRLTGQSAEAQRRALAQALVPEARGGVDERPLRGAVKDPRAAAPALAGQGDKWGEEPSSLASAPEGLRLPGANALADVVAGAGEASSGEASVLPEASAVDQAGGSGSHHLACVVGPDPAGVGVPPAEEGPGRSEASATEAGGPGGDDLAPAVTAKDPAGAEVAAAGLSTNGSGGSAPPDPPAVPAGLGPASSGDEGAGGSGERSAALGAGLASSGSSDPAAGHAGTLAADRVDRPKRPASPAAALCQPCADCEFAVLDRLLARLRQSELTADAPAVCTACASAVADAATCLRQFAEVASLPPSDQRRAAAQAAIGADIYRRRLALQPRQRPMGGSGSMRASVAVLCALLGLIGLLLWRFPQAVRHAPAVDPAAAGSGSASHRPVPRPGPRGVPPGSGSGASVPGAIELAMHLERLAGRVSPAACLTTGVDARDADVLALLAGGASAGRLLEGAVADARRGPVALLIYAQARRDGRDWAQNVGRLRRLVEAEQAPLTNRILALRALGDLGVARRLLSDPTPARLQIEGARLLLRAGELTPALELLARLPASSQPALIEAIGATAKLPTLERALRAADWSHRLGAARVLLQLRRYAPVERLLTSGPALERARLLEAFTPPARWLELLRGLGEEPDRGLRAAAIRAIGRAAREDAHGTQAVLADALRGAESAVEVRAAAEAMQARGSTKADLALELEPLLIDDSNDARRLGAIAACADLGLTQVAAELSALARASGPLRDPALIALGRLTREPELLAELARAEREGGPLAAAALGRHLAGVPFARQGLPLGTVRDAVGLALDTPLEVARLAPCSVLGLARYLRGWSIGLRGPEQTLPTDQTISTPRALLASAPALRWTIAADGSIHVKRR